jgi:NCS1 family nucleobase:cation symporter-1
VIFGKTIWDPVDVLTHFEYRALLIFAMFSLCIATLATNIAANVVSPANDFSHVAPRIISFRTGGFITGVVGIVMMPWKLLANPDSYIFQWLGGYGALLGPIGGILIADYFVYRRRKLNLAALYKPDGEYSFRNGISYVAIVSFLLGVLPSLPGFLVKVHQLDPAHISPFLAGLFDYAWFIGFALAFVIYLVLRKLAPKL